VGLGFPNGSNLIQFTTELNLNILSNLLFDTNFSFIRQGSVGNNFNINYGFEIEDSANETANWLEGDITNTYSGKAVISWQPLTHHKIKFGLDLKKIGNEEIRTEFVISYFTKY